LATNCNLSPILAHALKLAQDTIYFSSPEYKKKKKNKKQKTNKQTCASYETNAFHQRVFFFPPPFQARSKDHHLIFSLIP